METKMSRQYAEYLITRIGEIDEIGDELNAMILLSKQNEASEEITSGLKEIWASLGEVSFKLVNSIRADYPELDPDSDK